MYNHTTRVSREDAAAHKLLRASSGSALIRSRLDVSVVLDALEATVRSSYYSEQELFGIRLALETVIEAVFSATSEPLRLRYHLGADGLLVDVEQKSYGRPLFAEKALQLVQQFMSEVRVYDRGVTLYRRHALLREGA
jgi:hypothetical protein